jgi:hypothetical protein
MLKGVISKANLVLKDARQRLTVQSADAVEKVIVSIENLNNFINKEISRLEKDPKLGYRERSSARRGVLEQAGRKLEILKDRSDFSGLIQTAEVKVPDAYETEKDVLLKFMREREIRDRLFGMTEAQILSHFGESLFDGRNQLISNAILNAPPGFEMLSEHNLRKLRRIKAKTISKTAGSEPDSERDVNAVILEIFSMVKKELDHLRKEELAAGRTLKQP